VKKNLLRLIFRLAPILLIVALLGIPIVVFYVIFFGIIYFGTLTKIAIILILMAILIKLGLLIQKNPKNIWDSFKGIASAIAILSATILAFTLIFYLVTSLFPSKAPNCDPIGRAPIAGCE
jgi:hypothetical protein